MSNELTLEELAELYVMPSYHQTLAAIQQQNKDHDCIVGLCVALSIVGASIVESGLLDRNDNESLVAHMQEFVFNELTAYHNNRILESN